MAHQNQEKFSLSWDNYNTYFASDLYDLLNDGHLVDFTLAAEGRQIKVHRLVLSLCSPHFRQMFTTAIQPESGKNICLLFVLRGITIILRYLFIFAVALKNISYVTLKNLIQFMYCGEVNVIQEELAEFLCAAEVFQIKGLTDNAPVNHAPMEMVKTVPQLDVDHDDKATIVVQPTQKRAREQCNIEQTAPKRMKTRSKEVHSYPYQSKSFNELEDLVPLNESLLMENYTDIIKNSEFNYVDDQHDFDFATEPGDNAGKKTIFEYI